MRPDLAALLDRLADPVPGLLRDLDGLASAIEHRAASLAEDSYTEEDGEDEYLAGLASMASDLTRTVEALIAARAGDGEPAV